MNTNIEYVFFDLDGTLTDSGEGVTKGVAYALSKFDINITDLTKLYCCIGPPLSQSFSESFGLSPIQIEEAIRYFHEYYDTKGIYENFVYPGIPEILQALKNTGKKLVVATSKPDKMADIVLKHFDLEKYFDFAACATMDGDDSIKKRTTKSEVLQYALDSLQITDMSKIIMVGDRKFDVLGAKEFGIDTIGVLYGYGDEPEMKEAGAKFIAPTPEDILLYC